MSQYARDAALSRNPTKPRTYYCTEAENLLGAFGTAVQELVVLLEVQFRAVIAGDETANRFDLMIHAAGEKKQNAKYAYMSHLEHHGCSISHEPDNS